MKKLTAIWLSLLLVMGVLAGCAGAETDHKSTGSQNKETAAAAFPVSIKDAAGKTVEIKEQPKRIVSLIPSNTEVAYALGLGDKIVGRSDFDNYPKEVEKVEKIGGLEFNVEKVISLKPDLVLAHASQMGSKDGFKQLEDAGIQVLTVNDATSFKDVYKSINMIGEATGAKEASTKLVDEMKAKLNNIKKQAEAISKDKQKTVFVEVSGAPEIYTTGQHTFMDEMLSVIHAKNAAADQTGWVQMTEESIIKRNPDVIVTIDGSSLTDLKKRDGWNTIKAVKEKQVFQLNTDLASRPGPRLVEGVEALAKSIYPDTFK
ncbi:ABC transporter substrate-binding protein [Bacillus zhangzhouensis]|uniref:ABC transporter substrate-binding protein n=1 Tax=Bacillus zhangzhouensis TaxID=1178540 RepID=UPI00281396B9|nr:ABC transporter substrate-binding protein [Bacillus zhangzhouensis]MDR0125496.1 ABC transporter substrate-binding protein [Bacillus zhangzhouensis]